MKTACRGVKPATTSDLVECPEYVQIRNNALEMKWGLTAIDCGDLLRQHQKVLESHEANGFRFAGTHYNRTQIGMHIKDGWDEQANIKDNIMGAGRAKILEMDDELAIDSKGLCVDHFNHVYQHISTLSQSHRFFCIIRAVTSSMCGFGRCLQSASHQQGLLAINANLDYSGNNLRESRKRNYTGEQQLIDFPFVFAVVFILVIGGFLLALLSTLYMDYKRTILRPSVIGFGLVCVACGYIGFWGWFWWGG